MPTHSESEPQLKIGLTSLKVIWDWGWKLIPIMWFILQFYSNQNIQAKKLESMETRIHDLETADNKKDREHTDLKAQVNSLQYQMNSDKEFYKELMQNRH